MAPVFTKLKEPCCEKTVFRASLSGGPSGRGGQKREIPTRSGGGGGGGGGGYHMFGLPTRSYSQTSLHIPFGFLKIYGYIIIAIPKQRNTKAIIVPIQQVF